MPFAVSAPTSTVRGVARAAGPCSPVPLAALDCRAMAVVTGISDHLGWAELVTLSGRNGSPAVLDRRRVELVDPGVPSAPYHHEGLELPLAEAERIVARTRRSVAKRCRRVVETLESSLGVGAVAIQGSPYDELPGSLMQVLSSRALTCAADGMLYREELASQASALGLVVHRFPRRSDRIAAASEALGCSEKEVLAMLSDFGRSVGIPWRREHRHVAAAALCVIAEGDRLRK